MFRLKDAAHAVQQSWQANSHVEVVALLANFTGVVISMLRFDGTGSEVTREIWEMMLLTLWPRLELGGSVICGKTVLQSFFSTFLQLDVRSQSLCGLRFASLSAIVSSWCGVSVSANPWRVVHYISTVTASQGLFVIVSEHVPSRWRAVSCGLPCPYSRVGKTFLSILCDDSGVFWRCAPRVLLSCLFTTSKSG